MYGKGYVIEHCISLFQKEGEEEAYRIYVTDCLKAISENTTHLLGLDGVVDYGTHMTDRWYDIIHPDIEQQKKIEEFNSMTTDEVVDGIWGRMNRREVNNGSS